jgi:plasmid stabilization system protein ParE
MKLAFHPAARADLDEQLDFLATRLGSGVAERHRVRFETSMLTIQQFPYTSRFHQRRNVYETWIPRTRFIAFYRVFEVERITLVLAIIDHSKNTSRTVNKLVKSRT